MAKIFLNYNHDEVQLGKGIARSLEEFGHTVISVPPEQRWQEKLVTLLKQCEAVVILLTMQSIKHEWTVLEWGIAYTINLMHQRPIIIPVLIEGTVFPKPLEELSTRVNAVANQMDNDQIAYEISTMIERLKGGLKIFISHAHDDERIADSLVDVVREVFEVKNENIRATSLPEHNLPIGVDTPEQLRQEIDKSEAIVGIITPSSIRSEYVLFELGAAWALEKPIYPLLASGTSRENLPGPLKERNYVDLTDPANCYQMIEQLKSQKILPIKENSENQLDEAVRRLVDVAK